MANTSSEKELKTNWPIEEGLVAKTTKQTGRVMNLVPQKTSVNFIASNQDAGL